MPTRAIPPDIRRTVFLSLAAALGTVALKSAAALLTGSAGLFSDALESGVNVVTALTALFSIWYAARPADPNHAYGHEKIEFFSSGLEGALIVLAGAGTAAYAVRRWVEPEPLEQVGLGVVLALVATAVNFAAARAVLRAARRYGSPALEADGQHLLSDVWTTLAVVAGLALASATGVRELDALLAFAVGVQIARTGARLVRQAFDGLMDHAWPAAEQVELRDAIGAALPAGAAFHLVRTRRAGRRKFADFHLLVPGDATVRHAHALAHAVEGALFARWPDLVVTTHIEPIDEATSWEQIELANLGEEATPPDSAGGRP